MMVFYTVLAILVVATVYGGFQLLVNNTAQLNVWLGFRSAEITIADFPGLLLFSAAKNTGDDALVQTYSLHYSDGEMKLVNETEAFNLFTTSKVEFEDVTNPESFFFEAPFMSSTTDGVTIENRLYHVASKNKINVLASWPLTTLPYGSISWSSTQALLARTIPDDYVESDSTFLSTSWNIDLTDVGGNVVHTIGGGANPVWIPNSSRLLYVGNDGIYLYDRYLPQDEIESDAGETLSEDVLTKVLSFNDESGNSIQGLIGVLMDVSYDGKNLVVTFPGEGLINVFTISNEPFSLNKVGSVESSGVNYSWPVIAPDNNTYAVLARDVVSFEDAEYANPRIEVRRLDTPESRPFVYPLSDFNSKAVFLDDWIARPVELQ